jgi:hypothetical protein
MSDAFFDKFIADLVKGAEHNTSGVGVNIQVSRGHDGREEKLANHAGLGFVLGGPVGAAIGADKGQGWSAAGHSMLDAVGGGVGGAALGGLAGAFTHNPELAANAARLSFDAGALAGGAYGASTHGERPGQMDRIRGKTSSHYVTGAKHAAAKLQLKEAFLGSLIGSLAGGPLAKAGLGAMGKKVGGGLLGGAVDMAGSMAGGAIGNKLERG